MQLKLFEKLKILIIFAFKYVQKRRKLFNDALKLRFPFEKTSKFPHKFSSYVVISSA